MRWRLGVLIPLVIVLYLVTAWAGSEVRARWVLDYSLTLEQLSDAIIDLNTPLASVFAAGTAPGENDVRTALKDLRAAELEFEALGPPPPELAEAHAALDEAFKSYEQALERLARNLAADSERPFDAEFLSMAAHGGDQVHLASQALLDAGRIWRCRGASRLNPGCWRWRRTWQ